MMIIIINHCDPVMKSQISHELNSDALADDFGLVEFSLGFGNLSFQL